MLSTRENSIDSVIARPTGSGIATATVVDKDLQSLCNGGVTTTVNSSVNNSKYTSRVESVSSFDKSSTLNLNASALDTSSTVLDTSFTTLETKRVTYDPAINERINPFDKDKIAASRAAASAAASSSTSTSSKTTGDTGGYISNSAGFSPSLSQPQPSTTTTASAVSSSSYTTSSSITTSDKGDDNVKDRYNIQQGIRDQSQSGRFGTQADSDAVSNSSPAVSATTALSYSSETKIQEFARTKRSSSDAELIFGEKGPDFYKPRFSAAGIGRDLRKSNDSLSDAEMIFGTSAVSGPPSASSMSGAGANSNAFNRYSSYGSRDSSSFNSSVSDSDFIYGKKDTRDTFNKSLSISSEKTDAIAEERLRGTSKVSEPLKSGSSVGSMGSGIWNKYDEDDYDLK